MTIKTHVIRCKICDTLFPSVFDNGESVDEETCDSCWEEIVDGLAATEHYDDGGEEGQFLLPLDGHDYSTEFDERNDNDDLEET